MKKIILISTLIILCFTGYAVGEKLVWDANSDSNVAGYKVYWDNETKQPVGETPGTYTNVQDVDNNTQFNLDITTFPVNHTYYFAVTAYDSYNNESVYSKELAWDRVAAETPTEIYVENGILKWNSSTSTDTAGYKVYYGSISNTYVSNTDVGNVLEWNPTPIMTGDGTYYFAVTAYDNSPDQNESSYTNEVSIIKDTTPPEAPTNLQYHKE